MNPIDSVECPLSPLFPDSGEPLIIKQGDVGECYLPMEIV